MTLRISLAAVLMLSSTAALAAGAPETDAPAPAASDAKEKPKMVCRMETATGSVMPKRVCRTAEQAAADQENARRALDNARANRTFGR